MLLERFLDGQRDQCSSGWAVMMVATGEGEGREMGEDEAEYAG